MQLNPRNPVVTVASIFLFFIGLFFFLLGFGGNLVSLVSGMLILILSVWLLIEVLSTQHPGAPAS